VTDVLAAARTLADTGGTGALLTIIDGDVVRPPFLVDTAGRVLAGAPGVPLAAEMIEAVLERIDREAPGTVVVAGVECFVDVIAPPPTLRLFGAGPIAEALCRLAARAGFRVVVGDPRAAHALADRYPDAAMVSCGWPEDLVGAAPFDRRSYVVSLLHIERFEDPLLRLALDSEARYLGALGSRSTHASRVERLRDAGFSAEAVGRIHGPVGLSIGAVTPEEIAVSILAEMVQVRRRG
jgi:xanthine dehydrogenase accessory factor